MKKHTTPEEWFWPKINLSGDCWLWTGYLNKHGYGQCRVPGCRDVVKVHRASYELLVGRVEPGMNVLHKCDVRHCVNPSHLFLGTQRDNFFDMVNKGRGKFKGEENGLAKLTVSQVREIRILRESGASCRELAKQFPVSRKQISKICLRTRWTHVS